MNNFSKTTAAVSCGFSTYTVSLTENNSLVIETQNYPVFSKMECYDLTPEQMRKLSEMFLLRAIELENKQTKSE